MTEKPKGGRFADKDGGKYRILMVDDHPMTLEGYKATLLKEDNFGKPLDISTVYEIEDAVRKIKKAAKKKEYDLIFLDISLGDSEPYEGYSTGEDLAELVRKLTPNTKIVVLTQHGEPGRLNSIMQRVNPEGLLVKGDVDNREMTLAFHLILHNPPYYTTTAKNFIRQKLSNDYKVDSKNMKILYHLSRGVRTKNLIKHVDLSLSAIEKRKLQLKAMFGVPDGDDEDLIEEARKKGFV
ncbi:response regulator [Leptobacterium sp. I13]|uniref:response regulator n=1 Tax=Leptobacterium meishanense TaxID=3128904 RepID=UPI0030EE61AF